MKPYLHCCSSAGLNFQSYFNPRQRTLIPTFNEDPSAVSLPTWRRVNGRHLGVTEIRDWSRNGPKSHLGCASSFLQLVTRTKAEECWVANLAIHGPYSCTPWQRLLSHVSCFVHLHINEAARARTYSLPWDGRYLCRCQTEERRRRTARCGHNCVECDGNPPNDPAHLTWKQFAMSHCVFEISWCMQQTGDGMFDNISVN